MIWVTKIISPSRDGTAPVKIYDFVTKNSSFRNSNFEIGPSLMSAILKKGACQKWSRTRCNLLQTCSLIYPHIHSMVYLLGQKAATSKYKTNILQIQWETMYWTSHRRAETYAGRIWCWPLMSHVQHMPKWADRQTDEDTHNWCCILTATDVAGNKHKESNSRLVWVYQKQIMSY